jgi:D-lyxose ketol-isomerase
MKRSEINSIIRDGIEFIEGMGFRLPPFANWMPDEWRCKGDESQDVIRQQLGWDITDFGSGDFERIGLLLFTVRNGGFGELRKKHGKVYAEKIMVVRENQLTPTHFHHQKMEDIINRGGGNLVIRLWNSTPGGKLSDLDVTVAADGVRVRVRAGGTITLRPGESVCLQQRLYHRFWGESGTGMVLVGEVSRVNDDHVDNCFFDPVGRFPEIEEDEEPVRLLYNDYARYYGKTGGNARIRTSRKTRS